MNAFKLNVGIILTFEQIDLNITCTYMFIHKRFSCLVTKENLLMTKHAQDEANDDGISRVEIAEAISGDLV